MGVIYDNRVSIAFDLYGCPQACKHCWLGPQKKGNISFNEALLEFDAIKKFQEKERFHDADIEYLGIDYREPHFGDNYKVEYAVVDEINGTKFDIDHDFQLVSLWRIAKDRSYPAWCKERGIDGAQLKVFGGKDATKHFLGRATAYEETMQRAKTLIEHGMLQRFQIYLNRVGVDSLNSFFG